MKTEWSHLEWLSRTETGVRGKERASRPPFSPSPPFNAPTKIYVKSQYTKENAVCLWGPSSQMAAVLSCPGWLRVLCVSRFVSEWEVGALFSALRLHEPGRDSPSWLESPLPKDDTGGRAPGRLRQYDSHRTTMHVQAMLWLEGGICLLPKFFTCWSAERPGVVNQRKFPFAL